MQDITNHSSGWLTAPADFTRYAIENSKQKTNCRKEDSMKSRLAFVTVGFCLILCFGTTGFSPKISDAQVGRIEIHPLQTITQTDEQFLTGAKDGKPTLIAGELRIPLGAKDRLPAVVLVHGSSGILHNIDAWSQELTKIGIATFIFDGFTGRGISGTQADQEQLGRVTMINDTYRVLELLARHPRIDPSRIGLMGFSRGGQVALYASLKRFRRMHGPSEIDFAAYLAFYPTCNYTFIDDGEVSDRPIRLYHGAADDYVAIEPCRVYVNRLQKAGKDVQLLEYPDAYHNFDNPGIKAPMRLPQAQTIRNCRIGRNEKIKGT